MNKLLRKWLLIIPVLILIIIFQLFVTGDSARAEKKNVLKLGSLISLSLREGLEIKKWNDLFAKMVNEQGGWLIGAKKYRVKFFTYDVGYYDTGKQQAALERAIYRDGVKIFLNDYGDTPTITGAFADQHKLLTLGLGFSDEIVSTKYNYFFRPNGGFFGRAMNYAIYQDYYNDGARTYVVCTSDTEESRISAAQFAEAAKLAGLKVLEPVFFAGDTVDFGPVATKLLSMKPDVIDMCVCTGVQVTNLTSALKDTGWKGRIFPGSGLGTDTLPNVVKKVGSYFDGTEMLYYDPREIQKDPEMLALMDRYMKEYGDFKVEGCFWVGSWFVLREAINATQSVDPTVLKEYLEKGPPGTMNLVGYCQLFARPDLNQYRTVDGAPGHAIGIVKNGKLTYLSRITIKDQYLVSIKCYGLVDVYEKYWKKYGRPTFPPEESRFDWADLYK